MKELRECADETLDKATQFQWEQRERDGHMPKIPGCPVCVEEHGAVVHHFGSTSSSLHSLHLDTRCWGDLSLDGKRYFVVAGFRVQHEDKIIIVLFFIPMDNKSGPVVSQDAFWLIDYTQYTASCKQLQAFHGSKVLRVLSEQGTEFVNQYFHLSTSPAHQPQTNGVAERLFGLAKQRTRRLLLASTLPDVYWIYAMRFAEMLRHKALGFPWNVPACGEEVGIWRSRQGASQVFAQQGCCGSTDLN